MTTVNGNTVEPKMAEMEAKEKLQRLAWINANVKKLYEEKDQLIKDLYEVQGENSFVAEITLDGETEMRTFYIGKPTGHYVMYRELDMVVNQKTTKADQKKLKGE